MSRLVWLTCVLLYLQCWLLLVNLTDGLALRPWRPLLFRPQNLRILQHYHTLKGNVNVPKTYHIPTHADSNPEMKEEATLWPLEMHGKPLGLFFAKVQQMGLRRIQDKYPDEFEQLEKLGISWDVQLGVDFSDVCKLIKRYHALHGHVRIPKSFVVPQQQSWPAMFRNISLGTIVDNLIKDRAQYERLYPEMWAELVQLGLIKHLPESKHLQLFTSFYNIYHTLKIPHDFKVPINVTGTGWPEECSNFSLGLLVKRLRLAGEQDCRSKSPRLFAALTEMGFSWERRKNTFNMKAVFDVLHQFYVDHQHFNITEDLKVPYEAAQSLRQHRPQYLRKYHPGYYQELIDLGFPWKLPKAPPTSIISKHLPSLQHYYKLHKHLDIPTLFVVPEKDSNWPKGFTKNLGEVIRRLRKFGKAFWIERDPAFVEQLSAMNFHWNLLVKPMGESEKQELVQLCKERFGANLSGINKQFVPNLTTTERFWLPVIDKYYELHRNLDVRTYYTTPANDENWPVELREKSLGRFLRKIQQGGEQECRRKFSRLYSALKLYGFPWEIKKYQFNVDAKMDVMRQFYADHQHFNITEDLKAPYEAAQNLRRRSNKDYLRKCHPGYYQELTDLGFPWKLPKAPTSTVSKYLPALQHYYKLHKHLDIPTNFVVPENDSSWPAGSTGQSLGILKQRLRNFGKAFWTERDPSFVKQLDAMDFPWILLSKPSDESNKQELLRLCKERFGDDLSGINRHFVVPSNDTYWPEQFRGVAAGNVLQKMGYKLAKDEERKTSVRRISSKRSDANATELRWLPVIDKYYELYSNLDVQTHYITPTNDSNWPVELRDKYLGRFLRRLRLEGEQVCSSSFPRLHAALEQYDFPWVQYTGSLRNQFPAFKKFRELFGHLDIPKNYTISLNDTHWPEGYRGLPLGRMFRRLRAHRIRYEKIYPSQFKELALMDLPNKFEETVEKLKHFYRLHGHLRVPQRYQVPHNESWPQWWWGFNLGELCATLQKSHSARYRYEKKYPTLCAELDRMGFRWQKAPEVMLDRFDLLKHYYQLHGNLTISQEFVVPTQDKTWPEKYWGMKLGMISLNMRRSSIRKKYQKYYPDLCAELANMGFKWRTEPANPLEDRVKLLKHYYKLHGNLDIPVLFVVPFEKAWPRKYRGVKLGSMHYSLQISVARDKYEQKYPKLCAELKSMGFKWRTEPEHPLLDRVKVLKHYFELHGNLNITNDYRVPRNDAWSKKYWGKSLSSIYFYLATSPSKEQYEQDYPELCAELKGMGFNWKTEGEPSLSEKVDLLKHYYQLYGNLDIPYKFIIPVNESWHEHHWGIKLGVLSSSLAKCAERTQYEQDCPELCAELKGMGFRWQTDPDSIMLERVHLLKLYYQQYGNLKIARKFTIPQDQAWPKIYWGKKLFYYKVKASISKEKYEKEYPELFAELETMRLRWRKEPEAEDSLVQRANLLMQYFHLYGDLDFEREFLIPQNELWPKKYWGKRLFQYKEKLIRLRERYENEYPELCVELKRMGFTWQMEPAMQERVNMLKHYYKLHGHLNIPMNFVVPQDKAWPEQYWGVKLGQQYYGLKRSPARETYETDYPELCAELKGMGFNWQIGPENPLQKKVDILKHYYHLHGNLKITQKYKVPQDEAWPEKYWGVKLGEIYSNMHRSHMWGEYEKEYPELCAELASMGFKWRKGPEHPLLGRFDMLKQYHKLHGNLNIPFTYVVPQNAAWPEQYWGVNLGKLCCTLKRNPSREMYQKDYPALCAELASMGFEWKKTSGDENRMAEL